MKIQSVVPGASVIAVAAAQVVDLDIFYRNSYSLVNISLGTPPVEHSLLYDTGSSTLWLVDVECGEGCPNTSGFPRTPYNVSASSTGTQNNDVATDIEYVGGLITGVLASDVATVGNLTFNQTFAPAIKSTWQNLVGDGFLGLASSSIAIPGTTSLFENIMQNGLASAPRFGLYRGLGEPNVADSSPPNNGVLTLGGSREVDFADGPVRFVDTAEPFDVFRLPFRSWNMQSKGKPDVNIAFEGNMVVDTGAAHFAIPERYLDLIYSATPWTYRSLYNGTRPLCSEFTDDWSLSFTLGTPGAEQTFTVPGSYLANRGYQDDDHCFPPFEPWNSQSNIIIPNVWLKNFYSVFDYGSVEQPKVRVGFAPLKEEFRPKA